MQKTCCCCTLLEKIGNLIQVTRLMEEGLIANIDGDVNDVGYPLIQALLYGHLCVVLYSSVFDFNKGAQVMILLN